MSGVAPSPFSTYPDSAEAVVAVAKRRPCLVISNLDEAREPQVRVIPYYGATSDIFVRNRSAIEEGRYPRFMVLPLATWATKENILDFKAVCMLPVTQVGVAEKVAQLSADLLAAVRRQYSLYVMAERSLLG